MKQEEFVKGLTYLGIAYGKEFNQIETQQMYDFLKEYTYETFIKAIKNIIRTSKFVPKIADLIEECENCKSAIKMELIDFMRDSGYFKLCAYGEITDEHAARNYLKIKTFVSRGIIPDWLQEDMNEYYARMKQVKLANNQQQLIN